MFYIYRILIHQNLKRLQSMVSKLFVMMIGLVVLQTGSVFAQAGAANVVAHGVLALMGGGREAKQEKVIDQSTTREKISGSNVAVLRVKESDIKSKAKSHIITLQNRLTQYDSLYTNNQTLTIPKNELSAAPIDSSQIKRATSIQKDTTGAKP